MEGEVPIFSYFRANFRYFRNFRKEIFAKSENKFSRNFRDSTKRKIFVSTLGGRYLLAVFGSTLPASQRCMVFYTVFTGGVVGFYRNFCVCYLFLGST